MGKLVLIVDDSPTMLMSVRSTLEMRGFGVEAASDGELALAKLQGGLKPDLIITDVHMPKMSGLQFIKLLRELPGFRFTPVLTLLLKPMRANGMKLKIRCYRLVGKTYQRRRFIKCHQPSLTWGISCE